MKPTKKQLKEIEEIEKRVAKLCDANDGVVDEITGITYPKKTTEVTLNDKGAIINKETGKAHFQELLKNIPKEIAINLSFGLSSPTLKKQIKNQGFEISNDYIERAEAIRYDLNSLNTVGIIKDKELFKCFKRLNKKICKKILEPLLKDGEIAIRKKNKK